MFRYSYFEGRFLVDWGQVRLNGTRVFHPSEFWPGALFRWEGQAHRIDAEDGALRLHGRVDFFDLDERIHRRAQRVLPKRKLADDCIAFGSGGEAETDANFETGTQFFTVTDGKDTWRLELVLRNDRPLLLCENGFPPPYTDLYVQETDVHDGKLAGAGLPREMICFTPGTPILTEGGYCPVEMLRPGMRVQTQDNGPQELLWVAQRQVSAARLLVDPGLAPVHLPVQSPECAHISLSPNHKVVLRDPDIYELFGEHEVMISARHLASAGRAKQPIAACGVTYIHLLLPQHEVVFAGGMALESLHPQDAEIPAEGSDRKALRAICSTALDEPAAFGPYARRVLTDGDAELLRLGAMCAA